MKLHVGLVSISDRASQGVYQDAGIPALTTWLENTLENSFEAHTRLIADEQPLIEETLKELADRVGCNLILTTGGTGPAPRDVTPEATLAVAHKVMEGFGEQMRRHSLQYTPTAILSRQTAVIRAQALIVNLPGAPKSICETLEGIWAAIPYCVELIGGPILHSKPGAVQAWRPKSSPHYRNPT
jgi:molybdopterin adenylyltransferase